MSLKWIVVDTDNPDDIEKICESIREVGDQPKKATLKQAYTDSRSVWDSNDVVVYGPVQPTLHLTREQGWLSWLDLDAVSCVKYYAHFGRYLVQREYVMLPVGDLRRRWSWLYNLLGEDGELFVRPASNDKRFTAKCIPLKDCVYFSRGGVAPETLVVVSRPRVLTREYRLFMHGQLYLTGSVYREEGKLHKSPDVPESLQRWSETVAHFCHYPELPPVWVLDVAEVDGEYAVLEVSGSSCAGWYAADHIKIAQAVSQEAAKVFASKYNEVVLP